MARIVNHYSFLIVAVPGAVILALLLLRGDGSRLRQIAAVAVLAAVAVGYFLLRPGASHVSGRQAESLLATAGRPTLVEVYSSY